MKAIHGGDIYRNQVDIDFSVNVNPLGIPETVETAMRKAVGACGKYPDIDAEHLKAAVSRMQAVPEEYLVFGNGASELFMAVIHAIRPRKTVIPVPSFYGYEYAAEAAGGEIIYWETEEDFFDITERIYTVLTEDVDILFLANPNNPTGRLMDGGAMGKLLDHCKNKGIYVVLDECFIEFCGRQFSMASELERFDNLIIVRAFTKIFSVPGVRLGYLMCCNQELLNKIRRQLPEWNLSCFAQAAGCACALEEDYVKKTVEYVEQEREFLEKGLRQAGFRVFPSRANFILFYYEGSAAERRHEFKDAQCARQTFMCGGASTAGRMEVYYEGPAAERRHEFRDAQCARQTFMCDSASMAGRMQVYYEESLYEKLLDRGILIRDCSNFKGLRPGFYRIAVKTREENKILLNEIEHLLPEDIERRSFEIIEEELLQRGISLLPQEKMVTKRVIHTTADFDYAETLVYSQDAVEIAEELIRNGADIVTDTNMALAGINKNVLAGFGGKAHCFMAQEEIVFEAKKRGMTRAALSMEKASKIEKPVIFVIGNAPTALIKLYELSKESGWKPAFIIGVPVGFVNVEAAKELILNTDIPYIVNRGRKGGSNVAAAICNAILYNLSGKER